MRFYWPIAKVDADQHMVWGYASTEAEDDQGETVTRTALAAALTDYMRFANVREMHQPSAVGVATEAAVDDRGLYIAAKIVDTDAWEKVVEGVYRGFSIGGRVTARDPADRRIITGLRLTEISVVDRPANPEAVFDCWKLAAGGASPEPGARTPAQVWDCGVAGHRHLTKGEAMHCIAEGGADDDTGPAAMPGDHLSEPLDFADPGYQPDSRPRYPLDSERHIRAAWAFIHMPHNVRRYAPELLDRIKARIVAAWRAKIDPAGPPDAAAAPTRKGLDEAGCLAQIILDLDALRRRLGLEAAVEGDGSPLPERLELVIVELCDLLQALIAEESAELLDPGLAAAGMKHAALMRARDLRKRQVPDLAPLAGGLAKLAADIMPRLEALQQRVEDIAKTPLPPQAAARGLTALARPQDGYGVPPASGDDIAAALAQMSEEERTLVLIKAAHAAPIRPLR